jgi:hypothetical protein
MKSSRYTRRLKKKGGSWFGSKSSSLNNLRGHMNNLRASGNLPPPRTNVAVNNLQNKKVPNSNKQSVTNKTRKAGNNYENKYMKPTLRPRKVVTRPAWVNIVPNPERNAAWKDSAKGSE